MSCAISSTGTDCSISDAACLALTGEAERFQQDRALGAVAAQYGVDVLAERPYG